MNIDTSKANPYKIPLYCVFPCLIFGIVEYAVNIYAHPWILHNIGKFIPGIAIYAICGLLIGILFGLIYHVSTNRVNERLKALKEVHFYLAVFLALLTFIYLYCKFYFVFGFSGFMRSKFAYMSRFTYMSMGLIIFSLIFGLLVYLFLRKRKYPVKDFFVLSIAWITFTVIGSYINFELKQNILSNLLAVVGAVGLYFVLHYILPRLSRTKGLVLGILIFVGVFAGAWGKDYRLNQKKREKISRKLGLINKKELLAAQKPNIILFSPDTLRADHLSCYGYKNIKTPNIDKIADEGVLFTNCVSHAPWTLPAFTSVLTSLYPTSNRIDAQGLGNYSEYASYVVISSVVWLQEVLKDIGYTTQAFVNNPWLEGARGFSKGFDDYCNLNKGTERVELAHSFLWRSIIFYLSGDQYRSETQVITEKSLEWLESQPKQPFFLWIHTYDPHHPYERIKRYFKFPNYRGNILDEKGVLHKYESEEIYPEEEQNIVKSLYDEEILQLDENVGLIMQKLEELNLTRNTLFIFVSDHGEEFWDRSNIFAMHGQTMHRELLQVPLIISFPGRLPSGIIKNVQVRGIDIMPTVLDILGVKQDFSLQGESMLPIIEGKDNRNRVAYSECLKPDKIYPGRKDISYSTGAYKLIYRVESKMMQLYDIVNDPYEKNDIINEELELAIELKNQLLTLIDNAEKLKQKLIEGAEDIGPIELDSQIREKLKALGYIQ